MSDKVKPDDLGLGSDFDDALNAASDDGAGGDSVGGVGDDQKAFEDGFL